MMVYIWLKPDQQNTMFIKKSAEKKFNQFLGNTEGFRMIFKLIRKKKFEQTYNFCVTICFILAGNN